MTKLSSFRKLAVPAVSAMIAMTCFTPAQAQTIVEYNYGERNVRYPVMLRTNGLYDLAAMPNGGIEVQAPCGLALQMDYIGAWWYRDSKHHYYQSYAVQTELRYYFARRKVKRAFQGHHIGIYGQLATYDFEFGNTGYQCARLDRSYGMGVSYGYVLPLTKRLSLDLTAGIGWFHTRYEKYEPSNYGTYIGYESHIMDWIGATKLEAALVWNLNTKNK